jgi:response regulator NasT
MTRSLRIAIADDEAFIREYYQEVLPTMGHEVIVSANTGRALIDGCKTQRPDLVITDIKMPDMDGIDAAAEVCRQSPLPVILVSAYTGPDFIARAESDHILAYLIKPITGPELQTAIGLVMRRFEQFQALRQEAADLRQALEDRKVIERAKGILMKKAHLDEQDAFRRLQHLAREKNRKLVDIAHSVLIAEEAVQAPARG